MWLNCFMWENGITWEKEEKENGGDESERYRKPWFPVGLFPPQLV